MANACPARADPPIRLDHRRDDTGEEPAAKRAREHNYDPFTQVHARLGQFETLGHRVEKVELIVMGGTMTARPVEYQNEFVARCIEAMNAYPGEIPAAAVLLLHQSKQQTKVQMYGASPSRSRPARTGAKKSTSTGCSTSVSPRLSWASSM